jgi:hypothetical protein
LKTLIPETDGWHSCAGQPGLNYGGSRSSEQKIRKTQLITSFLLDARIFRPINLETLGVPAKLEFIGFPNFYR